MASNDDVILRVKIDDPDLNSTELSEGSSRVSTPESKPDADAFRDRLEKAEQKLNSPPPLPAPGKAPTPPPVNTAPPTSGPQPAAPPTAPTAPPTPPVPPQLPQSPNTPVPPPTPPAPPNPPAPTPTPPPTPPSPNNGSALDKMLAQLESSGADMFGPMVGSAVTKFTGSGTLGTAAGTFGSGVIDQLGPNAAKGAGIAGAALMVKSEINDAIAGFAQQTLPNAAGSLFSENSGQAGDFLKAGYKASDPLENITGINIMMIDDVLEGLVTTFQALDAGAAELADKLGDYSGEIAFQEADRQFRIEQFRLGQADTLGGDLANLQESRTDMDIAMMEIRTALLQILIPKLTPLVRFAANITESVADISNILPTIEAGIYEAIDQATESVTGGVKISTLITILRTNPLFRSAFEWFEKENAEDGKGLEAQLDAFLDSEPIKAAAIKKAFKDGIT